MVAPQDASPPENDPMGPPKKVVEVQCIHCGSIYMSDQIKWKPDPAGPDGGWWVCPIDGCDGAGFCLDIYPTDPEIAEEFGVHMWEDDEDDEDEFYDDTDLPEPPKSPPPHSSRFNDDDIPF